MDEVSKWETIVKLATVVDKLPAWSIWTKETFDNKMTTFGLKYCRNTARIEQNSFIQRHIGLLHDQLTTSLFS
jgi:hypothetical protein